MLLHFLFLTLSAQFVLGGILHPNVCANGTNGAPVIGNNIENLYLKVEGCEKFPCAIVRGQSYMVESKSKMNYYGNSMLAKVICLTDALGPVTIAEGVDLCRFVVNSTCSDIKPGAIITWKSNWPIPPVTPPFNGIVRMIVSDDSGVPQYCGEVPVLLQDNKAVAAMMKVPGNLFLGSVSKKTDEE